MRYESKWGVKTTSVAFGRAELRLCAIERAVSPLGSSNMVDVDAFSDLEVGDGAEPS
jgi:hypothetical protein